jgi:hypothetical protein
LTKILETNDYTLQKRVLGITNETRETKKKRIVYIHKCNKNNLVRKMKLIFIGENRHDEAQEYNMQLSAINQVLTAFRIIMHIL